MIWRRYFEKKGLSLSCLLIEWIFNTSYRVLNISKGIKGSRKIHKLVFLIDQKNEKYDGDHSCPVAKENCFTIAYDRTKDKYQGDSIGSESGSTKSYNRKVRNPMHKGITVMNIPNRMKVVDVNKVNKAKEGSAILQRIREAGNKKRLPI